MMMRDFDCEVCGTFESLVNNDQVDEVCPTCGKSCKRILSAPYIGSMNDPVKRAETLKKRSKEHSLKEAKANPEKIASQLGGKPKVQNLWNVRNR
jgi:putative FmdB family regulatory protein